jgi:hypothetical protein
LGIVVAGIVDPGWDWAELARFNEIESFERIQSILYTRSVWAGALELAGISDPCSNSGFRT